MPNQPPTPPSPIGELNDWADYINNQGALRMQQQGQDLINLAGDIFVDPTLWAGPASERWQAAWLQYHDYRLNSIAILKGTSNALNGLYEVYSQIYNSQSNFLASFFGAWILDAFAAIQGGADPVADTLAGAEDEQAIQAYREAEMMNEALSQIDAQVADTFVQLRNEIADVQFDSTALTVDVSASEDVVIGDTTISIDGDITFSQNTGGNIIRGPRTQAMSDQFLQEMQKLGVNVEDQTPDAMQVCSQRGSTATTDPGPSAADTTVYISDKASDASLYEEELHVRRAVARNYRPVDVFGYLMEETDVETQVLSSGKALGMTQEEFDNLQNIRNYYY